jgi:cytochrome P450
MSVLTSRTEKAENFTLTDPAFGQCPFADYEWMLAEKPVFRDPASGFLVVTRYDDVRAIAMDWKTWSNRTSQIFNRTSSVAERVKAMYEKDGWLPMDTVVSNDPPEHRRYRALVERALTPTRVKTIEPFIDATVDDLVAAMLREKRVEFMRAFAMPLTMTMLATYVGGGGKSDIERIRHWTDIQMELINPVLSPERELEITPQVIEFQHYLARAIERLRGQPNDTILSDLVHAEIDGQRLSVREIIAVATLFFGAGHDTTTSALGSCMRHFAENPATLDLLKRNPEKVGNFVEEILRLEAPIQRLFRRATRDTNIGDFSVKEGAIAVIQWGGANRDPRRFANPNQMNADRPDANKHLAFGSGIHFCVGNQLARAELKSAMSAITSQCAKIELSKGSQSFEYQPLFISRSLARLELAITPASLEA